MFKINGTSVQSCVSTCATHSARVTQRVIAPNIVARLRREVYSTHFRCWIETWSMERGSSWFGFLRESIPFFHEDVRQKRFSHFCPLVTLIFNRLASTLLCQSSGAILLNVWALYRVAFCVHGWQLCTGQTDRRIDRRTMFNA